jgi:AbrB family looped-hinge helix DNA binding protein
MARVSSKGAIIIPADIREKHGIKPGDDLDITEDGDCILLVPHSDDPIDALYGMFKDETSLMDEMLEQKRHERAREDHVFDAMFEGRKAASR